MDSLLKIRRTEAAIATKGISSDIIYRLVLDLVNRLMLSGDLLEYGAGAGALLKHLLDSNYKGSITGSDILTKPSFLSNEVHWIQGDLNEALPLPDTSFDLIISTEVIEHLENPRATFREFYRLLRPNGTLIVTTPNQESIRSICGLLVGGHFVSFLGKSYPAHITALLRKDFERLCLESDLSAPTFYYTNSGGIPKLPHIRWQKCSLGILKGRLFSDNMAITTKKAKKSF